MRASTLRRVLCKGRVAEVYFVFRVHKGSREGGTRHGSSEGIAGDQVKEGIR